MVLFGVGGGGGGYVEEVIKDRTSCKFGRSTVFPIKSFHFSIFHKCSHISSYRQETHIFGISKSFCIYMCGY